MPTYRKRKAAYEGEANRMAAIKRMRDSSSVAQQMTRLRGTRQPADSGPRGHANLPKTIIPKSQQPTQQGPPQQQMQAAKRAFQRAASERPTGRRIGRDLRTLMADRRESQTKELVSHRLGANANKRIPGHRMTLARALSRRSTASSRSRVFKKYGVSEGTYNASLNKVAQMRAKARSRPMHYLPQRRRGRGRPRSVNV